VGVEECFLLQSIVFERCGLFTNVGLSVIGGYCPELKHFAAQDYFKLTYSGVTALAEECPLLDTVRFRSCKSLRDGTLQAISRGCCGLISITLKNCYGVTYSGVAALAAVYLDD
jgi:hypothetical protein